MYVDDDLWEVVQAFCRYREDEDDCHHPDRLVVRTPTTSGDARVAGHFDPAVCAAEACPVLAAALRLYRELPKRGQG